MRSPCLGRVWIGFLFVWREVVKRTLGETAKGQDALAKQEKEKERKGRKMKRSSLCCENVWEAVTRVRKWIPKRGSACA